MQLIKNFPVSGFLVKNISLKASIPMGLYNLLHAPFADSGRAQLHRGGMGSLGYRDCTLAGARLDASILLVCEADTAKRSDLYMIRVPSERTRLRRMM